MEGKMKNTVTMMDVMANADDNVDLRRYKPLARLQLFMGVSRPALVITLMKDEEFEDLLVLARVNDMMKSKEEFPDEILFRYRTAKDTPLKGLMKFGYDEIVVDFKKMPDDHMVPEVIEAQRRFVVCQMIPKLREKLVMMLDRELTKVKIEEMRPEAIQRFARLAEVLVDGMSAEELERNGWGALKKRLDEVAAQ